MEFGSGLPVWDLNYPTWESIVTPSWLKATWNDMHMTEIFVRGPHTPIPLACLHDAYIMDCFVAHHATPHQLCNDVRLYKHLTCISDTVTANGVYLDSSTFTTFPPTKPTPYEWPHSTRPSAHALALWKHFLHLCFLHPHTFTKCLLQPLGPWKHNTHLSWDWWFSPFTDLLYQWSPPHWSSWTRHSSQYCYHCFHLLTNETTNLPNDLIRVTVRHAPHHRHALIIHFSTQFLSDPPSSPNPIPSAPNLHHILTHLPPSQHWAFNFIDFLLERVT